MLPPPGLEPSSVSSLLENATPSALASIATALKATSILSTGVHIISSTSTLSSLAFATATAVAGSQSKDHDEESDNGECSLLGPFAILVQGSLGVLALLSLVFKRWRERPQRPLKIWSFDVSKQVVGSVLVHIANLMMSLLSSGQLSVKVNSASVGQRSFGGQGLGLLAEILVKRVVTSSTTAEGKYRPNPCSFYLLNLAIDTTVGIPILILLLRILTALFTMTPAGNPPESLQSGNYGSPPKVYWWFKQSIIYFIGLLGMKLCVLIIFLVAPWISRIGDWALRWTEGDEVLQVVFVMLVFPVIMNATQYYIIDSFIKNQKTDGGHERIPDHEPDDSFGDERQRPYEERSGSSDGSLSGDEDDPEVLAKGEAETKILNNTIDVAQKPYSPSSSSAGRRSEQKQFGSKDYDPLFDGENSPTIPGSASTASREGMQGIESDRNRS